TVNALRNALSDGQYIETVARRGYRFTADVKVVAEPFDDLPPTPGGALPLRSPFYIPRPTDDEFFNAITRQDSIVLVKGARQVGKTSLLARGLQKARDRDATVILIDFQQFDASTLETADDLLLAIAESIADQLELKPEPSQVWNDRLAANINFDRYLRREVFTRRLSPLVWGLDEVDRLFHRHYASQIFGLFRSWHNLRALDPQGPWHRLTLAIAYAAEAHLFITDLNQSPFNVGTRLTLSDFTLEQVGELNRRYGEPLKNAEELARFCGYLGGHPYLTQRGLYEMGKNQMALETILDMGNRDEGIFGDHLKRLLLSLEQEPALLEELRGFLKSGAAFSSDALSRLRSSGVLASDLSRGPALRCELYAVYLKRHLS
ncbi:MAG TPA: AAA-like domain-containing protein, partial [Blastocatellia bacterium]|nr:AAA-like domain-containing protein [Blastocatellia bacterium]